MLALQDVDSALDQIEHRRRRLPEAAEHARALARERELSEAIAAAAAEVSEAEAVIADSEQRGEALTTKRTRLEAQLKTVISPREAEALMHEIATINAQRSELDDRELEALDQAAVAEGRRDELGHALRDAQAATAGYREALDAANAGLDAERDVQRTARPPVAAALSDAETARYDDLRRRFDGVAVARLDGLRCTGCHVDLSRAEADRVKALPADEAGECPQCLRLLAH